MNLKKNEKFTFKTISELDEIGELVCFLMQQFNFFDRAIYLYMD